MYLYVESKQALTQSFTTVLARGGLCSSRTCGVHKITGLKHPWWKVL